MCKQTWNTGGPCCCTSAVMRRPVQGWCCVGWCCFGGCRCCNFVRICLSLCCLLIIDMHASAATQSQFQVVCIITLLQSLAISCSTSVKAIKCTLFTFDPQPSCRLPLVWFKWVKVVVYSFWAHPSKAEDSPGRKRAIFFSSLCLSTPSPCHPDW